jgi:hypothetical protein
VIVYKITIADTVEERILALQEKKRELANQAIEGGAKMGAGKLGMKEILQLFRRDAEHAPQPQNQYSANYNVPVKPGVLRGPGVAGSVAGSIGGSGSGSRPVSVSSSREGSVARSTPPVGKPVRKEDAVYGRRW